MKIKVDFVTNSSSSSFVVMGTIIEGDMITEEHMPKIRELVKDPGLTLEEVQQYPMDYIETLMGSSASDFDFSTGQIYGDGDLMLGIPYDRMGGDETLNQLKQRVKDEIKSKLGLDLEVGHIEQCWMDN